MGGLDHCPDEPVKKKKHGGLSKEEEYGGCNEDGI